MLYVLSRVLSKFTRELVFQCCLIHIDLQDIQYFDFTILLDTFPCNFFLLFFWQHLHSCFLLLVLGMTCFCISKSRIPVLQNNFLSFGFCPVNLECSINLAVVASLADTQKYFYNFLI